ncbi:MAG TPA: hypothetical protein VFC04_09550 [Actinomycetota bacterium]|nr:hypothetical protein [Actinomycetota bacterium]
MNDETAGTNREGRSEEPTPTLREVGRRRADLHHSLVELEHAISSAAAGKLEEWTRGVWLRLLQLRETIDEHVEVTERPNGLYDEIRLRAPRLDAQITRLQNEHPEMRERTEELIARLEKPGIGEEWPLEQARDDIQRLLGMIVRHRQVGADLIWEAYNLDIGGLE